MQINIPPNTLEYAIDAVAVQTNAWGAKIILGSHRSDGDMMDGRVIAAVSPQTMKALYLVLKRQVEHFESAYGPVSLPVGTLHSLGEEIG